MGKLDGKKIAFLVAPEGVEQVELTEPWKAVADAGHEPVLVSTEPGRVQGFDHLDKADTFPVDEVVGDASADAFGALVLPGGVANPDFLRTDDRAVAFVKGFFEAGLPVAAICHAPWTLVEADVVRGRTLTSWPSLATDYRNAGAQWSDQELVVDEDGPFPLISSRRPADLPAFNDALIAHLS